MQKKNIMATNSDLGNLDKNLICKIVEYLDDFRHLLSLYHLNRKWRRYTFNKLLASAGDVKLKPLWDTISKNPTIDLDTLADPGRMFSKHINWELRLTYLSMNTADIIRIFNILECGENPVPIRDISGTTWNHISRYAYLTREFVDQYIEYLNMNMVLRPSINGSKPTFRITAEFLNKHYDRIKPFMKKGYKLFPYLVPHLVTFCKDEVVKYFFSREFEYIDEIFKLMFFRGLINVDSEFLDRYFQFWTPDHWKEIYIQKSKLSSEFREKAKKLGKISSY